MFAAWLQSSKSGGPNIRDKEDDALAQRRYERRFPIWSRRAVQPDGSTWLDARGEGAKWGVGCKACQQRGVNTVWGRFEVRRLLIVDHILQHGRSAVHQKATRHLFGGVQMHFYQSRQQLNKTVVVRL